MYFVWKQKKSDAEFSQPDTLTHILTYVIVLKTLTHQAHSLTMTLEIAHKRWQKLSATQTEVIVNPLSLRTSYALSAEQIDARV